MTLNRSEQKFYFVRFAKQLNFLSAKCLCLITSYSARYPIIRFVALHKFNATSAVVNEITLTVWNLDHSSTMTKIEDVLNQFVW